ncbi:MAG: lysine--tRNA ligase [Actinobacteria bacterium]|nr:MAG: lysine--tRNA ligase [Actinomycetota bacterium]
MIPYRFDRTAEAAGLQEQFATLAAGETSGVEVSVAGRLMLRRTMGKLAFGTLQDSGGRIQAMAQAGVTDRFEEFCSLHLGDWIGARGEVVRTKRGELSVLVAEWVLLAEARRQFPDKWHGVRDIDTRYRQRYVDLWVSDESRKAFLLRSRMVALVRRWLEHRGFVEVETPMLQSVAGGADARPFVTHHNAFDLDLYLRIAIELHLKRLVVGGFERVFEIGRVFRNEGISPRHNPEFTMLELYQAYADYHDMMELTEQLVSHLATELCGGTRIAYAGRDLDLTPPWRRARLLDLVAEHAGVTLHPSMPVEELRVLAKGLGVEVEPGWGPGKLVLEVYEKTTEAELWGPVFVLDYPKEVSPLARAHRDDPELVERFEPVVAGRELGNAFSELVDPDEQRARFVEQAERKDVPVDDDYLRALDYGLPPTGGLGIGIDRLAMLLSGAENIRDVLLFPTLRPEAPAPRPSGGSGESSS